MSPGKSIFDRLKSLFGGAGKSEQPSVPQAPSEEATRAHSLPGVAGPLRPQQKELSQEKTPEPDSPQTPTPDLEPRQLAPMPGVDLILGIDLGTSCTKVVIGDQMRGRSYVVPIGVGDTGLERFLRATEIRVGNRVEANLKMRLMENPGSLELRNLVLLYLAGVIRDALKWFSVEKSGSYRGYQPVWSVNLGFAAKQIDAGPLAQAYREIADLAGELGPSDEPLSFDSVTKLRAASATHSSHRMIPANRIALYPEIAAQLAGYVNSPYRTAGNLLLIDVGAGTLDVSTVILHGNQEEDIVSFHVCEVKPLGALKLMAARLSAIERVAPEFIQRGLEEYQSGTVPIPETLEALLVGRRGNRACVTAFEQASEAFAREAVGLVLNCAIRFRKLQRDGHANRDFDPWPGQLRFFFTGGGSRLAFYRDLFVEGHLEQELVPYTRWARTPEDRRRHGQGLRREPLPKPVDFQGLPAELESHFDRFSVAHGLAYGSQNLMKITTSVHA